MVTLRQEEIKKKKEEVKAKRGKKTVQNYQDLSRSMLYSYLTLWWNSLPCLQISCHLSSIWCKYELSSISDGASVTWYEPLPVKITSTAGDDLTPAKTKLLEGYPGSLSWNFSSTSVTVFAVSIQFNDDSLGVGQTVSTVYVPDNLKDRFNVTKISQRLTLVIFNVTTAYDESYGQFSCQLLTVTGKWRRKIEVKIVGKR